MKYVTIRDKKYNRAYFKGGIVPYSLLTWILLFGERLISFISIESVKCCVETQINH